MKLDDDAKPWTQSRGMTGALGALLVGVCMAVFALLQAFGVGVSEEQQSTVLHVVDALLALGAVYFARRSWVGRRDATQAIEKPTAARPPLQVLALVAIALLVTACSPVYSGATSTASISAYGEGGIRVVCSVDGSRVCEAVGRSSDIRVDLDTAKRICKAKAPLCTWTDANTADATKAGPVARSQSERSPGDPMARDGSHRDPTPTYKDRPSPPPTLKKPSRLASRSRADCFDNPRRDPASPCTPPSVHRR